MKLNEFEEIEREMQLDKSFFFGVTWWDLWRYSLYSMLSQPSLRHKNKEHISFRVLFQGITRLRHFFNKDKSIFILRHPRLKREGHLYVDVYTDIVGRNLAELGYRPIYFEKKIVPPRRLDSGAIYPLTLIFSISSFLASIVPILFLSKLAPKVVDDALCRLRVSDQKHLKAVIFRSVLSFRVRVFFYRLLFKLNKPSALFLVVSCGNEDIVCAAKKEGVVSIELQHGSPARGKLNYDYSNSIDKSYFPEVFLSFGPFFSDRIHLPSPCKRVVNFGYPYLQHKRRNISEGRNKKYDLLVLSQPDCDCYIVDFLRGLIKGLPDNFSILVQLHPQYYSNHNPYSELECVNFKVADSLESSLYEAFSLSRSAITVYSTAIYEARAFGLKTFVLLEERNLLRNFLCLDEVVAVDPGDAVVDSVKRIVEGIAACDGGVLNVFSDYSLKNIEELMRLID